ncbi:MAG: hypothetical protein JO345_14775 [Streptosporangiaceae bacterium]|nr:hypothetical protein [Streptosporangiaceae bacterium]
MTAPVRRPAPRNRLLSRVQWAGALITAAAALALFSLPPGTARADASGNDPVSGNGSTASAITVSWKQGVLDNTNTPIDSANADRSSSNPTSPLSFMYNDFQNLQVKVSQTQDITHQGITVQWTGTPTVAVGDTPEANFLQVMECYGDATSGPTPEQCEYGSAGMIGNQINQEIGQRIGQLCNDPHAVPSTTNPPPDPNGDTATGCDTQETDTAATAPACPASICSDGTFDVPFVPVSTPTSPDYGLGDTTYFSKFNTDEVQEAVTGSNGSGQLQFETLTGVQAPGLGCGLQDADNNNQARGCWLVIVPRGQYEPNGFLYSKNTSTDAINTSPLSASNWAQRIQIHLDFAPVQAFCPIGTLERQTVGTQLAARAVQSWQLALNHNANCAKIYGFSAVPESTSTQQLSSAGGAGLAFTTIPIGSEATRSGGSPPPNLPPILYAPVAISALGFGFNVNRGSAGFVTTPVKLTPVLVAKALTQSYRQDLPDYFPNNPNTTDPSVKGPAWAQSNPLNISTDPQFTSQALNPEIQPDPTGPINPLVTEEHSALTQQVWQWVQADSAASSWLGGKGDSSDSKDNVAVNPAYQALKLGQAPAVDSYPRADDGGTGGQCAQLGNGPTADPKTPQKQMTRCALDLIPYTDNFDSAAAAVLTANDPDGGIWDPNARASDGSFGWWDKAGVEPLGQIFMWAATDTSNLAAYGLIAAQLCNDDGSTCVGPTSASLTAALNAAKPDSSGLLHVDPANPGSGGYPLTEVTYAAVSTNQDATALNDYADLIAFAAGQGQTVGSVAGDLPPGYLPMPSNLQAQAQDVVTKLRNLASGSPSPSPTTSTTTSSGGDEGGSSTSAGPGGGTIGGGVTSGTTGGTTGGGAGGGVTPGATAGAISPAATPAPAAGAVPAPSGSHLASARASTTPPAGPVVSVPPATPAASVGRTQRQVVGAIRWALIGVMIIGGVFASGGTLLRSGWTPLWLIRRKPAPSGAGPPGAGTEGSP